MNPLIQALAHEIGHTFKRYMPAVAPVSAELLAQRDRVRDCMRRKRAALYKRGLNAVGKPRKEDNGRTMCHPDAKNAS